MKHNLIALVCYGNGYLAGQRWSTEPSCFDTKHGNFYFVRPRQQGEPDEEVASGPERWFAYLAANGALGLRIASARDENDHSRVWMMNGVMETVEVLYPNGESEYWSSYLALPDDPHPVPARTPFPSLDLRQLFHDPSLLTSWMRAVFSWPSVYVMESAQRAKALHAKNSMAPPAKPWKYMHRLEARGPSGTDARPDLDVLMVDLRRALIDIHDFATRLKASFIDWFAEALEIIDGRRPPTHTGFAPEGVLPSEAVRLISASARAWVFGGMMSWNDSPYAPPPDPDAAKQATADYDRVTPALYAAIIRGSNGGANASCNVWPSAA